MRDDSVTLTVYRLPSAACRRSQVPSDDGTEALPGRLRNGFPVGQDRVAQGVATGAGARGIHAAGGGLETAPRGIGILSQKTKSDAESAS